MGGSDAAALALAVGLLSMPSPLTLAVIAAIAVVVYEARHLARRLSALRRPAPAMTPPPGARTPSAASARARGGNSPAVPMIAAGESGRLAVSAAPHASLVAVAPAPSIAPHASPDAAAPPSALRSVRDRQLALASLIVAGLAAAWLVRRWSERPPSKPV